MFDPNNLECDHELCNRDSTVDLTNIEIEQIIMCGVEKGLYEVVSVDAKGAFRYRLTEAYQKHLGAQGVNTGE